MHDERASTHIQGAAERFPPPAGRFGAGCACGRMGDQSRLPRVKKQAYPYQIIGGNEQATMFVTVAETATHK